MSKLHVRHVREALERSYQDLIDLSDVDKASEAQRSKNFLTRSLAAFGMERLAKLTPAEAAQTVVDGSGDNGIDAIYVDHAQSRMYLVQAKWDGNGTGTIGLGDSRNFVGGFNDLTNELYDRFNSKIQARWDELSRAVGEFGMKFTLAVVTTGSTELAKPVLEVYDDFLAEMNYGTEENADFEILGLQELHSSLARGTAGGSIDLDLTLENWGTINEPYEAYYGVVDASVIGEWYENHGDRLFDKNLRNALGHTAVNASLVETLTSEAEHFWYFNNGVTILCGKVQKNRRGANTRTFGEFALTGASVVNGAQTVASVSSALRASGDKVIDAKIWVRVISLEGCPPDFATAVTRATNTQNTVESRDFVALDPEQDRLRMEMLLSLQKIYSIKRGDQPPVPATGCTITDATVALACASRDPNLAVQAKSTLGRLWESTEKPPYTRLFNSAVTAYKVWRSVEILRAVDAALAAERSVRDGKSRAVAVQGNRIVAHLVFRMIDLARIDNPDEPWDKQVASVPAATKVVLDSLSKHVEDAYGTNYVTSLFKNAGRCRDLVERVRKDLEKDGAVAAEAL
ncbi:putative abortive infection phage resistance protein [Actinoplanes philippinensis]|uniref:AIPR protein n=1 Tax=Actinoplanes philippinensis TaxID=35752 RepID=A0A1I2HS72_9ACTN|nr:AIPR family protein [Actinoplanes philippinensis]GIE74188.1 putative abortive infection phage resistance protein [Actinoplanes philippinensis]SFF31546.1 AIPR protein [Actinoplanes philippinensis]